MVINKRAKRQTMNVEALTTGRIIPSWINIPPSVICIEQPVIVIKAYISNLVRTMRFWNTFLLVRS